MTVLKVPVARGLDWMKAAVNVGMRNPRAVFGAAALFLGTLYVFAVLAVLPVAARLEGRTDMSLREIATTAISLFTVLTLVLPVLLAGLIGVMHAAEEGHPTRARDLFSAFGHGHARPLMALGLVQIVFNLACAALIVVLAGPDYWAESMKAAQGAMSGHMIVPPEPDHPALLVVLQLVQFVFNYFSAALMLLCVPLIMLTRVSLVESLKLGFRASVVNLGANLLASLIFIVGFVVAGLFIGVIATMIAGIAAMVHPALGAAITLLVLGAFSVMVLVVLVAASYYAWRDMFQRPGEIESPTPVLTQIEA